jgi:hypothetical protein
MRALTQSRCDNKPLAAQKIRDLSGCIRVRLALKNNA